VPKIEGSIALQSRTDALAMTSSSLALSSSGGESSKRLPSNQGIVSPYTSPPCRMASNKSPMSLAIRSERRVAYLATIWEKTRFGSRPKSSANRQKISRLRKWATAVGSG
jgi:hypothetical protein